MQARELINLSDQMVVERLTDVARPICRKRNVSTAFVVAKAISEMGYATVPWMVNANNLYGMNAYAELTSPDTAWASYKTSTVQRVPQGASQASWVYGPESMKTYRSVEDSIDDFCAMMVHRHHLAGKTWEECLAQGLPGYTTDKSWTTHVRAIIKKWGLTDKEESMTAKDITPDQLVGAVAAFAQVAYKNNYGYGDSHTTPPCDDKVTSCDRGIFRALWNLGFHDQRSGGETVITMEKWLLDHGWTKVIGAGMRSLRRGDIVLFKADGTTTPSAAWHTFIISSLRDITDIDKYDFGSYSRIRTGSFFRYVPLDEWGGKSFYAAFRLPSTAPSGYKISWKDIPLGYKGPEAYLGANLLKGRGYKGSYETGSFARKELALDMQWTRGDAAALYSYCADRAASGCRLDCSGGTFRREVFLDLTGGIDTISYFDAASESHSFNASVFTVQTLLKGRGLCDGKLDGVTGTKTAAAVREYRKVRSMPDSTKVDHDFAADICAGV